MLGRPEARCKLGYREHETHHNKPGVLLNTAYTKFRVITFGGLAQCVFGAYGQQELHEKSLLWVIRKSAFW